MPNSGYILEQKGNEQVKRKRMVETQEEYSEVAGGATGADAPADRVLERNPQPRPGDCLEVSSSGSGSRKAMNKSRNTVEKGAEPHRWEVCGMSASPRL